MIKGVVLYFAGVTVTAPTGKWVVLKASRHRKLLVWLFPKLLIHLKRRARHKIAVLVYAAPNRPTRSQRAPRLPSPRESEYPRKSPDTPPIHVHWIPPVRFTATITVKQISSSITQIWLSRISQGWVCAVDAKEQRSVVLDLQVIPLPQWVLQSGIPFRQRPPGCFAARPARLPWASGPR